MKKRADHEKGTGKGEIFDYGPALDLLVKAGIKREEVDHHVRIASDLCFEMADDMDALVLEELKAGRCVHPESLCIALALLTVKFLGARLDGAGERILDPVKCIEAVRKFVLVDEADDVETPTIH